MGEGTGGHVLPPPQLIIVDSWNAVKTYRPIAASAYVSSPSWRTTGKCVYEQNVYTAAINSIFSSVSRTITRAPKVLIAAMQKRTQVLATAQKIAKLKQQWRI